MAPEAGSLRGLAALGVPAAEKRREASGDGRDNTDRPQFQHDIDNLADASERILNRWGDGQNLHGCKEERVAEAMDVPALETAFPVPYEERTYQVHDQGKTEDDNQPREKSPVAFLPSGKTPKLFADH